MEYIGHLDDAIRFRQQLLIIAPQDLFNRLNLAWLCIRRDRREQATEILSVVTIDSASSVPISLMQVAHLRAMLDMEDALEFAYQSWRRGFDDPDIHLAFAAVFLNRDASNPINGYPDEARIGDAVDLRVNGKVNTYVIIENKETQ